MGSRCFVSCSSGSIWFLWLPLLLLGISWSQGSKASCRLPVQLASPMAVCCSRTRAAQTTTFGRRLLLPVRIPKQSVKGFWSRRSVAGQYRFPVDSLGQAARCLEVDMLAP